MTYTTLYYLMNEKHCLVEIMRNDLPEDSPKDEIYHWLSISTETNQVEKLKFKSMGEEVIKGIKMNVRTFENAEVRFDDPYAKFVIDKNGFILMNCSEELIPTDVDKLIKDFF